MNGYTILVCGSREWTDRDAVFNFLRFLTPLNTVIHGAAPGADAIAGEVAHIFGANVVEYSAEWERYGKAAGIIRNQRMLEAGKPDVVIAFGRGRGTDDMVKRAIHAGITTYRIERED